MKAKAFTTEGKARATEVELPTALFDGTVNEGALHQVITALRANGRQGTAATKTRHTVSGGNRKPWRQKGTGRARAGSTRSPLWRGGAVVFGPQPHGYRRRVPKKLNQLAIRSALNARAIERNVRLIEPMELERPRTRELAALLVAVGGGGSNVLLLTDGVKRNVVLSARNLQGVLVRPWGEASAYDILQSELVVIEESALAEVENADAGAHADGAETEVS